MADILKGVEQRRSGLRTPAMDFATSGINPHLEDYFRHLRLKSKSSTHPRIVESVTRKLVERAGWRELRDITVESVEDVIVELQEEGKSAGTQVYWIKRAKAFASYLATKKKLPYHVLAELSRAIAKGDIVRKRRSLDDGEIKRLLSNAPAPRKDIYKVLLLTGLRRSEAASLENRNVRLKSPAPFLRLRSNQTKTKKEQEIPLHYELIEFFSSRSGEPTERIFGSIPDVATLKKDLEAAEIEFETEDGRIDIHSLRHTFCRLVCDAEPDIKKAAKLTRHDDPMVLLKFYRNLKAVEGTETMRTVVFPAIESKPQRATGTDGAPLTSAVPRMSQITRIVLHKLAQLGIDSNAALRVASQRLSASSHDLASSRLPEPPTPDILSKSGPSTQVD